MEIIDEYPKTEIEAQKRYNEHLNYTGKDVCQFCKSDKISYPFFGFQMCNSCGKHALLGERFFYLEVDKGNLDNKPEITKDKVYEAYVQNQGKYSPKNKLEGNYYYWLGLLINEINGKKVVKI